MTLRISILTPGFTTPNGRAFLFPLLVFRRALAQADISVRLTGQRETAADGCDILIVDSKYYRDDWVARADWILEDFIRFGRQARVVYFDTTDSSGLLQAELFPHVALYLKNQILRDRTAYTRPLYGQRIYADYYHRTKGVADAEPLSSQPVRLEDLAKLRAGWNSGLADYSLHGPYLMAAYGRLPFGGFLQLPRRFTPPSHPRERDISCRFGASYPRASVAWQRQEIRRIMQVMPTDKIGRRAYFDELRGSKVVVSPFGFGEITLKDFETLLTGGLLLKPDMSHLETWPDLFQPGRTILCHDWDLEDFPVMLEDAVRNYDRYRGIAEAGQALYRRHLHPETGGSLFSQHLTSLMETVL